MNQHLEFYSAFQLEYDYFDYKHQSAFQIFIVFYVFVNYIGNF